MGWMQWPPTWLVVNADIMEGIHGIYGVCSVVVHDG
jgi:hypothetical protein